MTMTKQHFEAIARALFLARPAAISEDNGNPERARGRVDQWVRCVEHLGDVGSTGNIRFQRATFYDACGYTAAYGRT